MVHPRAWRDGADKEVWLHTTFGRVNAVDRDGRRRVRVRARMAEGVREGGCMIAIETINICAREE